MSLVDTAPGTRAVGSRRTALLACLFLSLGMGHGAKPAEAYLFLWEDHFSPSLNTFVYGRGEYPTKPRWDPAVWAPEMTLTVTVSDSPLWTAMDAFDNMTEVRRMVSRALATWSDLGSADIRWRLGGGSVQTGQDGIWILIKDDANRTAGAASPRFTSQRIHGCEITVEGLQLAHRSEMIFEQIVAHELGHCLGLGHTAPFPNSRFFPARRLEDIPCGALGP